MNKFLRTYLPAFSMAFTFIIFKEYNLYKEKTYKLFPYIY